MARPSKYRNEYADMLILYFEKFSQEPFVRKTLKKVSYYENGNVKENSWQVELIPKQLPTLFNFACSIGISHRSLLRWSKERLGSKTEARSDNRPFKYPEFCRAYKMVRNFQEAFITSIGFSRLTPSSFMIFTAKNVIGWRNQI